MTQRQDWNLVMVGARRARRHLPRLGTSPERIDWGKISAAHLDSGYTRHEVFGDWEGGDNWVFDGLNLLEADQPSVDPLDYEGNPGHGTRTCSVLCGVATEPTVGSEVGVAPRLPIASYRIINSVVLTPESQRERVAAAINDARTKKHQVVSMSLGTPTFPPWAKGGMGKAVDRAYEAGIIMVAAGGQIIDRITYPGKFERTIAVGGVTRQRRIWFRYERTKQIDVWAPAKDVLRADAQKDDDIEMAKILRTEGDDPGSSFLSSSMGSGKFGSGAGTSYATVHVAAAAAMWLRARDTDIGQAYDEPWQRVEAFRWLLKSTANKVNGEQPREKTGILDINALIEAKLPKADRLKKAAPDKDRWG
ncbi:MAG: S8/S53 family peptidase [Kiloniellales bacterium]|nr:S8/S53 family peptidase [Kiloniellales bacterium]